MADNFGDRDTQKHNLELWAYGFVSHHVDIFQIDSCIYILLFKKKEEKVIIGGLIGYSYLYYTILQYYTALSPFSILY